MGQVIEANDYIQNYNDVFNGDQMWQSLKSTKSTVYKWDENSSYIKEVPFFKNISLQPLETRDIIGARVLLKLGDTITTDHISPAGSISEDSPAGKYLKSLGLERKDFNSYGSRRGNHEVMVRGTFANVRLKNELVSREGGYTVYHETGELMSVYEASMKYQKEHIPLIVLAGKEYGSGSSRDWAAKGASLLGVKAIIAESFERIHRSNLVGMGILPLQFLPGHNSEMYGLKGDEIFNIVGLENLSPGKHILVTAISADGSQVEFTTISRVDSINEVAYYRNGGILQFVLRRFINNQPGESI
jgi:aconitate hydratase